MADNSPQMDDSKVNSLLDSPASKAEEDTDPLLVSTAAAADLDLDTVHTTPGLGHSPASGLGHSPGTPEEGTNPDSPATGIALSALTPAQLHSTCSQIVENMLSQALKCSEDGVHGMGEDTSCLSPTCSLGGLDPLGDICSAVSELVSQNSRFKRKTNFNCPKCLTVLTNTSHCKCGAVIEFPRVLFRKSYSRCMTILTKVNSLAKDRPADSARTIVTVHRWASYILQAHSIGYAGLLTNASSVHKLVTCNCYGPTLATDAKTETVPGVTATRANKGRPAEVGHH